MQIRHAIRTISSIGLLGLLFGILAALTPLEAQTASPGQVPQTVPDAPPSPVPVTTSVAARTCVTAQCHVSMGKDKTVHKPVQQGTCMTCHQAVEDPLKKTKHPDNLVITLVRQGADLCAQCHEPKNRKSVVHAPVKNGECTACHNPHQSPNKGMLKDDERALCFRCHPDSMVKQNVMHPPAAGGSCSGCHDHHQSDFPRLLTQDGNALCFRCHKNREEGLKTKKVAHAPVRQSCVKCHNPHGSAAATMLSAPVPELCATCHPKETAPRLRAFMKHGPMIDQKSCLNCHDPHVSDQPRLLLTGERALCLTCHNREMVTATGKIKDLKGFLEANKGGQGPLKGKPCATCHNPHGADYWRLLVKYYVPSFYMPYSDAQYSLCFSCHNKEAFNVLKTKATAALTNFRDGNKNLHFVHVNKIEKGRTCRACHEVCAECQSSGLPKHVKESVAFSGWNMPLNFIPSANGGSCAPGCHGEKVYSR